MLVIPAIDLKDGRCVRLRQGRMDTAEIFSDDPIAQARRWLQAGAERLHVVDLDGAVAGAPVHAAQIAAIARACPELDLQCGGGLRDDDAIDALFSAGARYAILGSAALRDPEWVDGACRRWPGRIMVSLDARDGMLASDGWTRVSGTAAIDLARFFEGRGLAALVHTDIARDGAMRGVNAAASCALAQATATPVIASGGINGLDDLVALRRAAPSNLVGVVAGRALYEGALDLTAAIAAAR